MDLSNPAIPEDLRHFLKDIAIPPEEEEEEDPEKKRVHDLKKNIKDSKGESLNPISIHQSEGLSFNSP